MMVRFEVRIPRWTPLERARRFRRSGISLLEVMFSIGVVMIGLVGIGALLPVGGDLARKGAVADAAAQVGANAVRKFSACGMNDPATWRWFNASNGQFVQVVTTPGALPPAGMSFCVDPLFIHDPAAPDRGLNSTDLAQEMAARHQFPLNGGIDSSLLTMPRITLRSPVSGTGVLHQLAAEELFTSDDDLIFGLPSDRTEGPVQEFSYLNSAPGSPLKRYADRDISWMATLVPKLDRVRNANSPNGLNPTDEYTLSIVVFDRRLIDRQLHDPDTGNWVSEDEVSERVVWVSNFYSGYPAFSGGDMTLQARLGRGAGDLELRGGDWLMLSREKPVLGAGTTRVHQWYRVVHAGDVVDTSPPTRDVTIVGPDWDYDRTGNPQLQTQATIVHGVVNVLEKTVRLEMSSMWTP